MPLPFKKWIWALVFIAVTFWYLVAFAWWRWYTNGWLIFLGVMLLVLTIRQMCVTLRELKSWNSGVTTFRMRKNVTGGRYETITR